MRPLGALRALVLEQPGDPGLDILQRLADGCVIDRQDELAFTYQSHDETKTHLMIFGLDERGRVYWFHPEWTVETDNPKAIRIESDGRPHDLREAIRHRFEGVRLEIHGLFLDRPASVRDVEEVLSRMASIPPREVKTDGNELLLKTNMGAGHGGKSGRFESLRETAEEFAFILWQLGLAQ